MVRSFLGLGWLGLCVLAAIGCGDEGMMNVPMGTSGDAAPPVAGTGAPVAGTGVAGAAGTTIATAGVPAAGVPAAGTGAAGIAAAGSGGAAGMPAAGSGPAGSGAAGMAAAGSGAAGMAAAGSGGAAGMAAAGSGGGDMGGAAAGSGGAAGAPMTTYKPPCMKNPSEVVLIGDSYINYLQNLAPRIQNLAIADGALMRGQMYRDRAVAGSSLATGGFSLIPPQLDSALRENPNIKFVVLDGGGNDVLLGNQICLVEGASKIASCTDVATKAIAAARAMLEKMRSSGVAEVVQFFYPTVPAGGKELSEWAIPKYKESCESMTNDKFRCHFVDTRPTFEGKPNFISSDDIHPSSAGADALAAQLWGVMKEHCIAQPASSGCCVP
jgi:lysophospholipase L1-like esterase